MDPNKRASLKDICRHYWVGLKAPVEIRHSSLRMDGTLSKIPKIFEDSEEIDWITNEKHSFISPSGENYVSSSTRTDENASSTSQPDTRYRNETGNPKINVRKHNDGDLEDKTKRPYQIPEPNRSTKHCYQERSIVTERSIESRLNSQKTPEINKQIVKKDESRLVKNLLAYFGNLKNKDVSLAATTNKGTLKRANTPPIDYTMKCKSRLQNAMGSQPVSQKLQTGNTKSAVFMASTVCTNAKSNLSFVESMFTADKETQTEQIDTKLEPNNDKVVDGDNIDKAVVGKKSKDIQFYNKDSNCCFFGSSLLCQQNADQNGSVQSTDRKANKGKRLLNANDRVNSSEAAANNRVINNLVASNKKYNFTEEHTTEKVTQDKFTEVKETITTIDIKLQTNRQYFTKKTDSLNIEIPPVSNTKPAVQCRKTNSNQKLTAAKINTDSLETELFVPVNSDRQQQKEQFDKAGGLSSIQSHSRNIPDVTCETNFRHKVRAASSKVENLIKIFESSVEGTIYSTSFPHSSGCPLGSISAVSVPNLTSAQKAAHLNDSRGHKNLTFGFCGDNSREDTCTRSYSIVRKSSPFATKCWRSRDDLALHCT